MRNQALFLVVFVVGCQLLGSASAQTRFDDEDSMRDPVPSWETPRERNPHTSRPQSFSDGRGDERSTNVHPSRSRGRAQLNQSLTRNFVSYLSRSVLPQVRDVLRSAAEEHRDDAVLVEMHRKSSSVRLVQENDSLVCPVIRNTNGMITDGALAGASGSQILICHFMSNLTALQNPDHLLVILHEIAHLAGERDECLATEYARKAMRAAGVPSGAFNPYSALCGGSSDRRQRAGDGHSAGGRHRG
jgi:hypothetical protein